MKIYFKIYNNHYSSPLIQEGVAATLWKTDYSYLKCWQVNIYWVRQLLQYQTNNFFGLQAINYLEKERNNKNNLHLTYSIYQNSIIIIGNWIFSPGYTESNNALKILLAIVVSIIIIIIIMAKRFSGQFDGID